MNDKNVYCQTEILEELADFFLFSFFFWATMAVVTDEVIQCKTLQCFNPLSLVKYQFIGLLENFEVILKNIDSQ